MIGDKIQWRSNAAPTWPGVFWGSAIAAKKIALAYVLVRSEQWRNMVVDHRFVEDEGTDTQLVLVNRDDSIGQPPMVVFPGTVGLRDWNRNRKVTFRREVDRVPGSWHRGYVRAAESTIGVVEEFCDANEGSVVIAGHSLGGAVATITAAMAASSVSVDPDRSFLVTFGAPRCASPEAARALDDEWGSRSWRWVFQSEAVPGLIPPIGYRHAGRPVYVSAEGRVRTRRCVRHFVSDLKAAWVTPGLDLRADHGIARICDFLMPHLVGQE